MHYGSTLNSYQTVLDQITHDLESNAEQIILEQLNDFVSRGLLVVERTQPILVHEANTDKITIRQSIRLTLKDKEYILKLEKENQEMKDLLEAIKHALPGGQ